MSIPLLLRRLERDDDLFPTLQVFQPDHTVRISGFQNLRALQSEVLSVAVTARRAVYSNFELRALCSRHVTKWRRVLPPAGVALIADRVQRIMPNKLI